MHKVQNANVALAIGLVVWLQVVGLVTEQKLTHVFEALPLAILAAILILKRDNAWLHATATLLGFFWIFMLTVVTPELQIAVQKWTPDQLVCYLAPVMVLLSAGWMATNLTILRGQADLLGIFLSVCVLLIPICWLVSPLLMAAFFVPLRHVVSGQPLWGFVLLLELAVLVAGLLLSTWAATGNKDLRWSVKSWGLMAAFWIFFLICMITSQLPGINPSAPRTSTVGHTTKA